MKRYILFFCFVFFTAASVSGLEVKLKPIYKLNFMQGYAARGESIYMGAAFDNQFGLSAQIASRNSLILLYNLKYDGPGIKVSETQKFEDKTQDHFFLARYDFVLTRNIILGGKYNYISEYYKSGTTPWLKGQFNFSKPGYGLNAIFISPWENTYFSKSKMMLDLDYSVLSFPNFKDLLKATQSGTVDAGETESKLDQSIVSVNAKLDAAAPRTNYFVTFNITKNDYIRQGVILDSGTTSTSDKQVDQSNKIGFGFNFVPTDWIFLGVQYSIQNKSSNQQLVTRSSNTFIMIPDYYSYMKNDLLFTLGVKYGSITLQYVYLAEDKNYISRTLQSANGTYLVDSSGKLTAAKLTNLLTTNSVVLSIPMGAKVTLNLNLTTKNNTTNNEFKNAFPKNFDAWSTGCRLTFEY